MLTGGRGADDFVFSAMSFFLEEYASALIKKDLVSN